MVCCRWIKILKQWDACPVKMVPGSTKTGVVINIINSCSSEHKSASPKGRTSPFVWYSWHTWSVIADCISSTLLYETLKPSVNTLLIILFFCVHECNSKPVLTGRVVFWKDRWRTLMAFCSCCLFRALNFISCDSWNAVFLFWLSAAKERLVPSGIICESISKLFGTESVWQSLPKFPKKLASPSKRSWHTSFAACSKCKPFWSPLYESAAKIASVATLSDVKAVCLTCLWACKPGILESSCSSNLVLYSSMSVPV